jgi:DNA-binding SARP family transcriptional activator
VVQICQRFAAVPAGAVRPDITGTLGNTVVDPSSVDAHRFTVVVRQARRLTADASPEAARCCDQALALFRGPALAGIDNDWARREASQLDELRLATIEERVALGLAAGQHADLAGGLESLVAEHPLRERLHEQLMLALYRSGRQADAARCLPAGPGSAGRRARA